MKRLAVRSNSNLGNQLHKVWVLLSSFTAYTRDINRSLQIAALQERKWQFFNRNLDDITDRQPEPDVIAVIGYLSSVAGKKLANDLAVPCINISSAEKKPGLPSILPDNAGIGQTGAEFFLRIGLRNFAYFGVNDAWFSFERLRGFRTALQKEGMSCSSKLVSTHSSRRASGFSTGVRRWLQSLKRPCGILTVTDNVAVGLIAEIQKLGFRVPEDFAMLGIGDDDAVCPFCNPTLSSIPLPGQQIGRMAVKWLNLILEGNALPEEPVLVPAPEPVLRESTQIYAPDNELLAEAMQIVINCAPSRVLTAQELAELCGVTRRTLDRHFLSRLKITPKEAIDQARLEHLKRLLGETGLQIKQIAPDMGFASTSHMARFFKRMTGQSPGAYRLLAKQ